MVWGVKNMFMKIPDDIKLEKPTVTLEDRIRIKRLLKWRNDLKNKMQSSMGTCELLKKK